MGAPLSPPGPPALSSRTASPTGRGLGAVWPSEGRHGGQREVRWPPCPGRRWWHTGLSPPRSQALADWDAGQARGEGRCPRGPGFPQLEFRRPLPAAGPPTLGPWRTTRPGLDARGADRGLQRWNRMSEEDKALLVCPGVGEGSGRKVQHPPLGTCGLPHREGATISPSPPWACTEQQDPKTQLRPAGDPVTPREAWLHGGCLAQEAGVSGGRRGPGRWRRI